jgi:flavin-binding protein dodecin
MSVAKIIEWGSESPKSFEDAIQSGIARASKTTHGTKSAWVKEQHLVGLRTNLRGVHREDLSL